MTAVSLHHHNTTGLEECGDEIKSISHIYKLQAFHTHDQWMGSTSDQSIDIYKNNLLIEDDTVMYASLRLYMRQETQ